MLKELAVNCLLLKEKYWPSHFSIFLPSGATDLIYSPSLHKRPWQPIHTFTQHINRLALTINHAACTVKDIGLSKIQQLRQIDCKSVSGLLSKICWARIKVIIQYMMSFLSCWSNHVWTLKRLSPPPKPTSSVPVCKNQTSLLLHVPSPCNT